MSAMQMIHSGALLREGAEAPTIETEADLRKLAGEVLENPSHEQYTIAPVFDDYLKKLS